MIHAGSSRSQFLAVLFIFLREWPQRAISLVVPVIGAAGSTFILVAIFAIANGISDAMRRGGEEDVAIVLDRDAQIEASSHLSDEDINAILTQLNVLPPRPGAREIVASSELVQTVDTLSHGGEAGAQVLARGISAQGIQLRKKFRILEGRMFTPGKLEVIVGRRLARDFAGLELGTTLTGSTLEWVIVGVFEDDGGTAESEVWMDLDSARTESGSRVPVSSLRIWPVRASELATVREALRASRQLQVQISSSRELQSRQFSQAVERIRLLSLGLALLLGVGAVVASVNTMAAVVVDRARAVATLRALGFGPSPTVIAVFMETTLLGIVGGALGASAAFVVANGYGLSVLNGATSTPFALSATVTAASVVQGVLFAACLTTLAAILPCISVAKQSIISTLNHR